MSLYRGQGLPVHLGKTEPNLGRVANKLNWKYGTLLPYPSIPFRFFPFPSLSLPPLRSRALKSSYDVWGSAVSSPAGSGAEPQPKSNLMHFSFKIWHLLATILMIFLKRINWLSFNLDTKTLRSCIHLLYYFNTICPQPKNGTFGVPGSLGRDAGLWGQNTGRPVKYRTVGNPRLIKINFYSTILKLVCENSLMLE